MKPQITRMTRISLNVHKDSVGQQTASGPSIDTKQVTTEVLVENGGTVVIGGIYTQDERTTVNKVPVLGDMPYVGFLFRSTIKFDNRNELLIFVTRESSKTRCGATVTAFLSCGKRRSAASLVRLSFERSIDRRRVIESGADRTAVYSSSGLWGPAAGRKTAGARSAIRSTMHHKSSANGLRIPVIFEIEGSRFRARETRMLSSRADPEVVLANARAVLSGEIALLPQRHGGVLARGRARSVQRTRTIATVPAQTPEPLFRLTTLRRLDPLTARIRHHRRYGSKPRPLTQD